VIIDYTMDNESQKTRTVSSYAVIAIVAALALFGVVAITTVNIPLQQQQAEAASSAVGRCAKFNSQFHNGSSSVCGNLHP
jgi:hypothetical protein